MEFFNLIEPILQDALAALLVVVCSYITACLHQKVKEIGLTLQNEREAEYLELIEQTICDCVAATTQTYVDTLKKQDAFTKEAQQQAFQLTLANIKNILTSDAIEYIEKISGDVEGYLTSKIEANVFWQKEI